MPEIDPIKLHLQGFNYSGGWSDGAVIRKTYVGDLLASEVGEAVFTAESVAAAREAINAATKTQVYYAKDHGVVADGSTDDRTALNALIATVSTAGGGVILLPVGTVKVNGQVAMASNVTLRGHGWESVIKLAATAGGYGVLNIRAGDDNVVIEDLKIDANRGAFTSEVNSGIWGDDGGYENVLVRNVWVTGTTYNGITFLGSSTRAAVTRGIRVVDCLVDDCGGTAILTQNGVDDVWVDRCTVRDYGQVYQGLGIVIGRYGYDQRVTNCLVDGTNSDWPEAHGISIDTVYGRADCSGNTISNCVGYGIEVGHIVNGSISNNTITGGSRTAIAFTSTLLAGTNSIRSNIGVTVSGNTIDGTESNGIAFIYNDATSAQNCPASATVTRSTAYTAAATNRVVYGRRFYECTTSGTTAASEPAGWGTSATGDTITDGTAVWTDRGSTNAQVALTGNIIRNVGGVGVYLAYCHQAAVTGNIITNTALSGIKAEATANMYTVTGNEIQGCNNTSAAGHGGLVLSGYTGAAHVVKVDNNRVANSGVINMMAVDSSGLRIDDRFTANATAPTVAFGSVFVTQNSAPTTIATLGNHNSVEGRTVMVRVNDANTTFQHSSSGTNTMRLVGGANFTPPAGTDITFVWEKRTNQWIEVARSSTGAHYVNAKDFGAKGDGSTDDTTALQTWLTYICTNSKQGYLPNGTYKITSTLVAPGACYGWGITGENQNYAVISQFTDNTPVLQVGTSAGSSHTINLTRFMLKYNAAQSSSNTNANCIVFDGSASGDLSTVYWSSFRELYFLNGYYGMTVASTKFAPWGCEWDMIHMQTMSGGLYDNTASASSGCPNNRWGRATLFCGSSVGPIFKNIRGYNMTIDTLEFLTANQGAQLMTTASGFTADIGSLKLEVGSYTGAGKGLFEFSNPARVRIGSIAVGGSTAVFTPSSGIQSIVATSGAASGSPHIEIGSISAAATSLTGTVVAINGGGNRFTIGSVDLANGWTLQYTGGATTGDLVTVKTWVNNTLSGNKGDADYTVALGDPNVVQFTTAFTAQRTITLPTQTSNDLCGGLYYDLIFSGAINGANTAVIKRGSTTMRTQTVDNKRLRYMWHRQGTSGQWILVDVADLNPDATMATTTGTQTLSAKTLSSPKIDNIYDTGGAAVLGITPTASGVNYLTVTGSAAAGASTSITATGSDSSVAMNLFTKGTGAVNLRSSTNGVVVQALPVASGVNYIQVSNATTGNPSKISAIGSDTNVSLNLVPKGTGSVQIDGNTASAKVSVPANATAAGKPGQWAADSSYIYTYTGDGTTHTWVRATAATW